MCSIIGSFDPKKIEELAELNRYRGEYSHSICIYSTHQHKIRLLKRHLGPFKMKYDYLFDDDYIIVHQQAPTGPASEDTIHPAQCYQVNMDAVWLLWHNGILKPATIKMMQDKLEVKDNWDSLLLCNWVRKDLPLDEIDGSFSCLYFNQTGLQELQGTHFPFKLFRNEIAPMFYDDKFNFSSTKFEGSQPTKAGVVYDFLPERKKLIETDKIFKTMNNPYILENTDANG